MVGKKSIQIIMNVTHGCNLACQYCYYKDVMAQNAGSMDLSIVERIFKQVAKSSFRSVNFIIHGGEPLLKDSLYYREFFKLQQKYLGKKKTSNSIQTNGTLIDECFIKNYIALTDEGVKLGMGISLDGPREVHDRYRLYKKDNTGTFNDIMNNIDRLNKHDKKVAILAVAPITMPEYASSLYDFFKSIKNQHFLDIIVPNYDSFPLIPDYSLSTIYKTIFDSWFFDKDAYFDIRFFNDIILATLTGKNNLCAFQNNCIKNGITLSIGPNGDISFCDSFPEVQMDNIWKKNVSFDNLIDGNNKVRSALSLKEEDRLKECLFCKWYKICNGGCPSNHMPESNKAHYFCEEYQRIFSHIADKLKSIDICEKEGLSKNNLNKFINPRLNAYLHRMKGVIKKVKDTDNECLT